MIDVLSASVGAAGGGALVAGLWLEWMNRRAGDWPCVQGTVTRSTVEHDAPGAGAVAEFAYRFTVNGFDVESSRVSFAANWSSEAALRDLVARLPTGQSVNVWYDPNNPSMAVIERETSTGGVAVACLGAMLFALGVLIS